LKLIEIVKLIPLRDETGKVYKWQEELNLVSPMQVQRVRLEPNVDKVVLILTNTEQILIDETLKEFNEKFMIATT